MFIFTPISQSSQLHYQVLIANLCTHAVFCTTLHTPAISSAIVYLGKDIADKPVGQKLLNFEQAVLLLQPLFEILGMVIGRKQMTLGLLVHSSEELRPQAPHVHLLSDRPKCAWQRGQKCKSGVGLVVGISSLVHLAVVIIRGGGGYGRAH